MEMDLQLECVTFIAPTHFSRARPENEHSIISQTPLNEQIIKHPQDIQSYHSVMPTHHYRKDQTSD